MTIEDLKRLDKRLRQIPDPFGYGFPTFRQTIIEVAEKYKLPVTDLAVQYTAWKWKK
jgi:dTDP-glucose pyrophosphorylase